MTTADDFVAYHYTPSKAASGVFAGLFAVVSLWAVFQMIQLLIKGYRGRVWALVPFIVGGVFEVVGYIGRILSADEEGASTPYIMQSVLLLVAPALFSATIYMTLAIVIKAVDAEHHSLIRLKWLTKIFVIGDVLSFFVQASGAGLMSQGSSSTQSLGQKILIVGLFIQIAFFGFFICVMAKFAMQIKRAPTTSSVYYARYPSNLRNWKMVLLTLFVCSTFVFIRSIVRAVEFIQGNDGYIISHEIFLFIFDGAMMFLTMFLYALQNPIMYYFQVSDEIRRNGTLELKPIAYD